MPTQSSPRPSFEQARKQAKRLLRLHRTGTNDACGILRKLARFAGKPDSRIVGATVSLQEMQLALAKSHGAESWAKLREKLGVSASKAKALQFHFPAPHVPGKMDKGEFLLELCLKGAKRRLGGPAPQVLSQIRREVGEIRKRGLETAFLAVWEVSEFLRANRIPRGPGRGNQPTSTVLFSLGFTDIEPLSHGLRFQRLLREPGTHPYFEMDISHRELPKIGAFLNERYGAGNVARLEPSAKQAITISTGFAVADSPISQMDVEFRRLQNGEIVVDAKAFEELSDQGCFILYVSELRLLDVIADARGAATKPLPEVCSSSTAPIEPSVAHLLAKGDLDGIWDVNLREFPHCPPVTPEACKTFAPKNCNELALAIAFANIGYVREDKENAIPRLFPQEVGMRRRVWPKAVAEIVAQTGGVPVYQDQIMEIGEKVGGLRGHNLERFLRSFRDETPYRLRTQEEFRKGAVKAIGKGDADKLIDFLKQDRWWFNRGHAIAYAHLVLSAACLKAAYPQEYAEAVRKNS